MALALGAQMSWANPAALAAELRAMACCADHSERPMSVPESRACCGVTATATGPAERPVAAPMPTVAASLVTFAVPVVSGATGAAVSEPSLAGVGPPAFLAHRHLLI